MKVVSKQEVLENKDFFIEEIRNGKIFIYPTDTLYGLGTHAKLDEKVRCIYEIKKRDKKPLLIVAPSLQWIEKVTILNDEKRKILEEKLPGPYSFILPLSSTSYISEYITAGKNTIGVRIPDNWFAKLVEEAQIPFTSTSVNISGQAAVAKIKDVPLEIKEKVDYIVEDDNGVSGKGSTIVDLSGNKEKILRK